MSKGKLKNKIMAFASSAVMAVSSLAGAVAMPTSAVDESALGLDNYAKLLQYSLYFYDANYCGVGAGEKSHFSWRDDCHTDGTANGGFHDAGDGIICGITEGFTASTLGWLYYEYKDEFQKTGTYAHFKDISTEFAEFFKNCTTLDGSGNVTKFIYEIGDDGADHGKWRAPELMSRNSSEYYSTTDGASNTAAQYAAALAQHYINFGDEESLTYAKALYDFAAKNRKMTYDQQTYQDKSVEDDIAWAAGWLYLATGEQPYLDANSKDTSTTNDWVNDYYYGGVWLGAAIINAEITGNWFKPVNYIQGIVNQNQNKFYVMNSWGSARHNTLMQTCALIATKHKAESGADFAEWCKGQTDMILGKNNANVCLVVGYNDVSATSPHHRAASGLYVGDGWEEWNSWNGDYASVPTSHILYGALCGGPTSDDFSTFRKLDAKDATSNEVALDYQVGLVGAAVGLYHEYGTGQVVDTIGDEVTVYPEEIAVAKGETPVDSTTTTTETTNTTETTATTETTTTIETIETTTTQTTVSVDTIIKTTASATTTIVGHDPVDVSFVDRIKEIDEYTRNIEFVNKGHFVVKDDETFAKLVEIGAGNVVNISFKQIELFMSDVYSLEKVDVKFGDANMDGSVNVSDAVLIMQSLSNPTDYKLSEIGAKCADVVDNGSGVTAMDALAIQMIGINLITENDLPTTTEKITSLVK
ncbi:MAG: glycoside hydrolase family 9 protein [Ruminococcus sp.]|nr:glycoside hydrolase family 9 protein [Ruminococcus sp.]